MVAFECWTLYLVRITLFLIWISRSSVLVNLTALKVSVSTGIGLLLLSWWWWWWRRWRRPQRWWWWWWCLLSQTLFFLVCFLNQRWTPSLRFQVSHCSAFCSMCEVLSIAVFCKKSIECVPGIASGFFLKLYVTIPLIQYCGAICAFLRF